jgi:HAD superfamily hydrolase (TIGR01509 family)
MSSGNIKALLIDLDGTLVDSTPALYQVYLNFLAHYGHEGNKEEFQSLIGPSIDEIVVILQKKYNLKGSHHDLSMMYISFLMMQGFQGTELFPGAKQVLKIAKDRGIKLGIVTSGTQSLTKICLDPLQIYQEFDVIVTSEDVAKAKPSPEIYQAALQKLQVKPDEAIAIEDSSAGISAAKAAGLKILFITHGKPKKMDSDSNVTCVANWNEIESWLKSK